MTPAPIPVFLNGRQVLVAPGSTLAELVAQEDPELGRALAAGQALATDGRGIAVAGSAVLPAGSILRVAASARATGPADA